MDWKKHARREIASLDIACLSAAFEFPFGAMRIFARDMPTGRIEKVPI